MARRGLEEAGCQVAEAPDGVTALTVIDDLAVDVAVLDRRLPGMSGLELLTRLRRRAPSTHIIMLTGAGAEADRVLGLSSGADDYMVKPFSARELAARVVAARRRHALAGSSEHSEQVQQSSAVDPPVSNAAEIITEDTTIVSVTEPALHLVGAHVVEQVLGRDVFELFAPESVDGAKARHERVQRHPHEEPEPLVLRRLDGARMRVLVSSAPARWEGRAARSITIHAQIPVGDNTGERASPEPDEEAVVAVDSRGQIRTVNPAAERLFGWTATEVYGRSLEVALGLDEPAVLAESALQTLARVGHWKGQIEPRRGDGSTQRLSCCVTLLRDLAGESAGSLWVARTLDRDDTGRGESSRTAEPDLAADIQRGLARGEFVVFYQPIVRLEDASVVGAEALVRWQHPSRGLLTPAAFLDTAERCGAINDLDALVLDEARAQWARWRDAGRDLYVSVNLSGRQLADPTLLDRISSFPMPEGQLWLEVTETSLIHDLQQAAHILNEVAALGAKISIDDFGTGWASLSYLREFPVHALKIDRSFVHGAGTSSVDTAIVSSVLSLGRELALNVVAEGIETVGQQDQLRELGCHYGQGYLFGRPTPTIEEFGARSR